MNNHKNLYVWLLITSLLMVSCATQRNHDDTIDVCKLTTPPKEAVVKGAGHLGRSFIYPDPRKIPANYSGCVKAWLGDYNPNPETIPMFSIRFNNGLVSHIDSYDTDGAIAVMCEYDDNEKLTKETLIKKHDEGCTEEQLLGVHEIVNDKGGSK